MSLSIEARAWLSVAARPILAFQPWRALVVALAAVVHAVRDVNARPGAAQLSELALLAAGATVVPVP